MTATTSAPLRFDRHHHRYTLGSQVLPSVTEIVAPLNDWRFVRSEVLHAAAHLGTCVHQACEAADLGTPEATATALPLAWRGYLTAWQALCRDHAVRWRLIEAMVHHPNLGYAGTLDRFGQVRGEPTVVDLKTGSTLPPSLGPQLAAYARALPAEHTGVEPQALRRLGVQLRSNGTYRAQAYEDPSDWSVFASLLTLQRYCAARRITPRFTEICA